MKSINPGKIILCLICYSTATMLKILKRHKVRTTSAAALLTSFCECTIFILKQLGKINLKVFPVVATKTIRFLEHVFQLDWGHIRQYHEYSNRLLGTFIIASGSSDQILPHLLHFSHQSKVVSTPLKFLTVNWNLHCTKTIQLQCGCGTATNWHCIAVAESGALKALNPRKLLSADGRWIT